MDTSLRKAEKRDYFEAVIKDAIKDLKKGKTAYVFLPEHVKVIKSIKGFENIKIILDEGIYYLSR